jgi:predicted secreted protein
MKHTGIHLILFLLMISSCRYDKVEKDAPFINDLPAGKKFRINLPEEHRSGYIWQLDSAYSKNSVELLNSVWHGNEGGVDFNFLAGAPGTTTLTFIKRMYRDTSEMKRYILRITAN